MTDHHTTINGHQISLTARDQYNDYSVVYDYTLDVDGRRWHLGTSQATATKAYRKACEVVSRYACSPTSPCPNCNCIYGAV